MARDTKTFIYGRHALTEALEHAPETIKGVFFTSDMTDSVLRDLVKKKKIFVTPLSGNKLPQGVDKEAVHQGVIAEISLATLMVPYAHFLEKLVPDADTAVVILAEVQDPHNVGAVIRSAAAFGIAAVLIPEHNQAPVTGAVVKVSAGMAFRVPLVSIGNVNNTIHDLKERGFWVYGLAGEGAQPLASEQFDRPTAFVLGNEAKGIRMKTMEHCDALISIPISPRCESLNASASAAVALYAWSTQHPTALK